VYPTRPGRLYLAQAAAALLVLLFAQQQQLIELPVSGRVGAALPDAIHGTWFACVTWIILSVVGLRFRPGVAVALTAAIGFVIAVGTELLQSVTGGDAEIGDVFFDMVGMTAAICAWSGRKKLIPRRLGLSLAVLLLVASLWPIVPPILLDRYRNSIVPDLVRFDAPQANELVSSNSVAQIVPAPDGWSITGPVLGVTLAGEKWPGIHLNDPTPDWRRFSTLEVDAFVEGRSPMPITISVRLDYASVDHVFKRFDCAPGPCRLQLPFTELFDPAVARVNAVVIFSERSQAGRMVYFGRIALRE
jgi:hypothetical protein